MITFDYLTLFVEQGTWEACKSWYINHLDLKTAWESEGFVLLRGDRGANLGLHVGQPLQRPEKVQLHFKVPNVDRKCKRLKRQGVEIHGFPQNTSWGYRVAVLRDPAGHTVELFHQI